MSRYGPPGNGTLEGISRTILEEFKISSLDLERRNHDKVIEQLKKDKRSMEIQRDYFTKECVKLQGDVVRLEKTVFKLKN